MNRISKQIVLIARELEAIEKEAGGLDTLKNLVNEVKNTLDKAKENGDKDQRQRAIDNIREVISCLETIAAKSNHVIAMMLLGQKKQVAKTVSKINDKKFSKQLEEFFNTCFDQIQKTGITEALKRSGVRDYTKVYDEIGEQNQGKFDKLSKDLSNRLNQKVKELNIEMEGLLDQQKDKPTGTFNYGEALDTLNFSN